VHSHGHVLEMAREWIGESVGAGASLVVHDDTAGACEALAVSKDAGAACIASRGAAEASGLEVISEIPFKAGEPVTRYFVLARDAAEPGEFGTGVAAKTSISCVLKNQPGALFRALSCFALRSINVSKLEMVPRARSDHGSAASTVRAFEYTTFLDVESGESTEQNLVAAIANLREYCTTCKVLGTYPRFSPALTAAGVSGYGV
jgi:prephenate dehydratase